MSFRRKKYDGDIFGGSFGITERGNPLSDQSKIDELTAPKRTNRNYNLNDGENIFSEEGDKDRYIITYADLITLLLGLFIILYAISNIDTMKYEKMMVELGSIFGAESKPDGLIGLEYQKYEIKNEIKPINEVKTKLQKLILENNYTNSIDFEESERGFTIHILGDILFPPGTSNLNENSKKVLSEIADLLRTIPNNIRIEGHTDNVPVNSSAFPSNWHLSTSRALNTGYYLINKEGLNQSKISITGYAEFKPVTVNDTPEGRANNRRVDIVILNN